MKTALETAIDRAGGQSALGKLIGVSQQRVWAWLNKLDGKVSSEFCIPIERATGVSRYALRPDVYGSDPRESEAA